MTEKFNKQLIKTITKLKHPQKNDIPRSGKEVYVKLKINPRQKQRYGTGFSS
jgi:hypothetical protein